MSGTVDTFEAAIVVVGNFNPPIFSPDWLERNNLLGNSDAEIARKSSNFIVSKDVTQFETNWFAFQVVDDRFSLSSRGPVTPQLRDLAVGIFSLVSQTPIRGVGLNFMAHYKLASDSDHHRIGDALAPKTIWKTIYPDENVSAGMANVTTVIEQCKRGEKPKSKDSKRISVQPSTKVPNGVYFAFNDHHEIDISIQEPHTQADLCVKVITEKWQASWNEATQVFDGVIKLALQT